MTAMLEKAFKKAAELPSPLQEELAAQMLQDMAGEGAWDATLASPQSQQMLDKLADAALTASRAGKTRRKGFGEP